MFGEISILAWLGGLIMFAIGGATGFFISRQLKDKRTRELEEKLTATRMELVDYRSEVNQHFLKTSLLVSKLTNDYREVYEHLATGAQKLCKEKPGTPKLDLPETKILSHAEAPEEAGPAAEPVSETAVEAIADTNAEIKENEEKIDDITVESSKQDADSFTETAEEKLSPQEANRPNPEDIVSQEEDDEDIPLGVESAPSVDTELHKTHPSVH